MLRPLIHYGFKNDDTLTLLHLVAEPFTFPYLLHSSPIYHPVVGIKVLMLHHFHLFIILLFFVLFFFFPFFCLSPPPLLWFKPFSQSGCVGHSSLALILTVLEFKIKKLKKKKTSLMDFSRWRITKRNK